MGYRTIWNHPVPSGGTDDGGRWRKWRNMIVIPSDVSAGESGWSHRNQEVPLITTGSLDFIYLLVRNDDFDYFDLDHHTF